MIKLIKSSFFNEKETKKELVDFMLKTEIFSMNKECEKFEKAFSKKQKRKYSVFVNSGSSANLILIQALLNLGLIKKQDKVGFSALTWATNVMPLIQLGLNPIAIDCEKRSLNISSKILKKHIGKINVLFLTNTLGFADDIEEIRKLCKKHKVILLEDNCESLGSKVNGKLLGNFGLASTFSFFIGHHISTIEGGMVCTDNKELYEMLLMVRAHGWDRNLEEKSKTKLRKKHKIDEFFAKYSFYDLAYNCRPTEINGFIGNTQIKHWNTITKNRESNFKKFHEAMKENKDLIPIELKQMSLISNFAMPIICKDKKTFEKFKKRFEEKKIEIRPIIAGDITKQPFYKKYVKIKSDCPNAKFIHKQGFYFPNNPELTEKEIKTITELLK